MFEKLLSNLPYNPSLVHQLSFYAKRMRREEGIRRTGLVFMVLAFFVQFFAVVAPPVATVAYSSNDMINGGIQTQAEAVTACKQNTKNYGDVLWNFGISCSDVANASVTSFKSTDVNGSGQHLYSMGWLSEGKQNTEFNNLAKVSETLYARRLDSFDTGPYSTYKVLKGTSHVTGKTFFIIFDCGNLVFFGIPQPLPICKYDSSLLASDSACKPKPCQLDSSLSADSPKCTPCQYDKTIIASNPNCHPAFCPQNPKIYITDSACKACPSNPSILKSSKDCHPAYCPQDNSIYITDAKCQPCKYDSSLLASNKKCVQCTNPRYPNVIASGPQCKPVCPYNPSLDKSDANCKPCDKSVSSTDNLACIQISKTASDDTQGWNDANGKTAQAGDVITYDLYAENVGKAVVPQFTMTENISDVLDYADVTDLHGGTLASDGWVTWPAQDIPGGQKEHHQITVKVKDPIPQTPTDPGDQAHFDLTMTNTYGNTIDIHLPGSITKTIETASTALPNTGPGTSLAIAGAIVIVAGYFFARARLLVDESVIAVHQSANHGGM